MTDNVMIEEVPKTSAEYDWEVEFNRLKMPPRPQPRRADPEAIERGIAELHDYDDRLAVLQRAMKRAISHKEHVPIEFMNRVAGLRVHTTRTLRMMVWRRRNRENPEGTLDRPSKGVALTVHLRPSEIAVLDWIAYRMLMASPQTIDDEPTRLVPGRAEAIRSLIESYQIRYPGAPYERLKNRQMEWGDYWVREASWRRAGPKNKRNGKVTQPKLPGT